MRCFRALPDADVILWFHGGVLHPRRVAQVILEQHENHREMHLTKSPLAPRVSCWFTVRDTGLEEVCRG